MDQDEMGTPIEKLVQGKKYRVEFSDCCVNGEFTGVFVEHVGTDHIRGAVFDTGRVDVGNNNFYEVD